MFKIHFMSPVTMEEDKKQLGFLPFNHMICPMHLGLFTWISHYMIKYLEYG